MRGPVRQVGTDGEDRRRVFTGKTRLFIDVILFPIWCMYWETAVTRENVLAVRNEVCKGIKSDVIDRMHERPSQLDFDFARYLIYNHL